MGLDCENYTPSPNARLLHIAGELFPAWWSSPTDVVVAPDAVDEDRAWLKHEYGIELTHDFSGIEVKLEPWGWSRSARRQFILAGVSPEVLPDDSILREYRELSHRATACKLLAELDYAGAMPLVTDDVEAAMRRVGEYGSAFVKSPWSGSGRGVFNSSGLGNDALRRRIEGIIHRQGSVIVERPLRKIVDFAMLFDAGPEGVTFRGMSLFETEGRGMYAGNVVAPQGLLMEMIQSAVPHADIRSLIGKMEMALGNILRGRYSGPLGVDMMIHDTSGVTDIMPCIEVNLRRTMGFVAKDVAERLGLNKPLRLSWIKGEIDRDMIPLLRPGKDFTPVLS